MLTFGEIHTGLLQHSTPLARDQVAALFREAGEGRIRQWERPVPYAVSADRTLGVDCRLPSMSSSAPHVVGTVQWHAAVTGGHIAQGSVHATVLPAEEKRRLPWSHYTALPGRLETLTKAEHAEIAKAFLYAPRRPDHLDTDAIARRALASVSRSELLDRRLDIRTRRTRLRWSVLGTGMPGNAPTWASFQVATDELRTMEVAVCDEMVPGVIGLCEDLALHDWLLTTLTRQLDSTLTTPRSRVDRALQLQPVVDYFVHLWAPAARVDETLTPVWEALDQRAGLTRLWQASVARIRDQIALSTMDMLRDKSGGHCSS